jgi:hypothetical protein
MAAKNCPNGRGALRCDHHEHGGERDHQIFIAATSNASLPPFPRFPCFRAFAHKSPTLQYTAPTQGTLPFPLKISVM